MEIKKIDSNLEIIIDENDDHGFLSDFFASLKLSGVVYKKNGVIKKIKLTPREEEIDIHFNDDELIELPEIEEFNILPKNDDPIDLEEITF